ncbi:MAG: phosphoglucosamine mutase [Mycobacteriaceae bacterium]
MGQLFGTDGVRGLANRDVTAELALSLGAAAAAVLATSDENGRQLAVVGHDPRASSEMLEAAVTAGLTASGVDVLRVGVLPTPAVAYATGSYGAALGVMISASHNAMPDNGIKIFSAGGHKLDDNSEERIELTLNDTRLRVDRPIGAGIGRTRNGADALSQYLRHLQASVKQSISGLTVVVDCAHGAAFLAAPQAYRLAGATVITINDQPDGLNINEGCGSTHMEGLSRAVVEHGADLGLAHDGDADRCLAVDSAGNVVDGDQIMAILALAMHEAGELFNDTLVATVMSNLGLHLAMKKSGIILSTTAVGDRYVLEELRSGGYSLGGEQSGHIVLPKFGTTGDGILTGLQLMSRMAATGSSLAELAAVMTVLPQVLINVPVRDKATVALDGRVQDAVVQAESELGDTGRVLLRPSGTEQVVRVMVEAAQLQTAQKIADHLATQVGSV